MSVRGDGELIPATGQGDSSSFQRIVLQHQAEGPRVARSSSIEAADGLAHGVQCGPDLAAGLGPGPVGPTGVRCFAYLRRRRRRTSPAAAIASSDSTAGSGTAEPPPVKLSAQIV